MSELGPNLSQPEVNIPTPEELRAGLQLNPTETIAFDITPAEGAARRSYDLGEGLTIEGKAVAEFQMGGHDSFANALILNTGVSEGRQDVSLLVSSSDRASGARPFVLKLQSGPLRPMGRKVQGQESLPDTVSGTHCFVGINEQGQMVILNNNPTNSTRIRSFGV